MAKDLEIVQFVAENFKKLRVVRIDPHGRLIQLTGRNGQGKTSVLDALWFLLEGQQKLPTIKQSVIRNGAESMRCFIHVRGEDLEFTVTRGLTRTGSVPTLTIEMIKGERGKPQAFLDDIFGALTFDPLAFVRMAAKEQVAELRRTAKIDLDFEKIAAENEEDYKERHKVNQQVKTLEAQLAAISVLDGLPKEKLDEGAVLAKLNNAAELNRKAQELFQAKQTLGAEAARIGVERTEAERRIQAKQQHIEALKQQLKTAEGELKTLEADEKKIKSRFQAAEAAFHAAPEGQPVDVAALTAELTSVQRTNAAIDRRAEYDRVRAQLIAAQNRSQTLSDQMTAREEKKQNAIRAAKMPIPGLTFDEVAVYFNGIPIENLGEGEQIRISTLIGMSSNPKLRVMCIRNGEALDDDGIKMIAEMAEEHKFQVWMTRVETSGKVGIVLEDGMVAAVNESEPEAKPVAAETAAKKANGKKAKQ
jgi:hypothetical protein